MEAIPNQSHLHIRSFLQNVWGSNIEQDPVPALREGDSAGCSEGVTVPRRAPATAEGEDSDVCGKAQPSRMGLWVCVHWGQWWGENLRPS